MRGTSDFLRYIRALLWRAVTRASPSKTSKKVNVNVYVGVLQQTGVY